MSFFSLVSLMRFVGKPSLILFFFLEASDVIGTGLWYRAGIAEEGNPLFYYLFATIGFFPSVLIKIVLLFFALFLLNHTAKHYFIRNDRGLWWLITIGWFVSIFCLAKVGFEHFFLIVRFL